ncbi:hypothetical protein FIBSPDRAFT_962456 [Athelia psychrophila]|uniref:Uncharacterized protein n=1 Tax=Athelia psychrophila TaxID=1759441 RepID=A0A166A4Y1_9AGAM|nr:hypothetical protein FIBSPDRAFT_962456 [Fibularhizoctonia sp. CBS 109695]
MAQDLATSFAGLGRVCTLSLAQHLHPRVSHPPRTFKTCRGCIFLIVHAPTVPATSNECVQSRSRVTAPTPAPPTPAAAQLRPLYQGCTPLVWGILHLLPPRVGRQASARACGTHFPPAPATMRLPPRLPATPSLQIHRQIPPAVAYDIYTPLIHIRPQIQRVGGGVSIF